MSYRLSQVKTYVEGVIAKPLNAGAENKHIIEWYCSVKIIPSVLERSAEGMWGVPNHIIQLIDDDHLGDHDISPNCQVNHEQTTTTWKVRRSKSTLKMITISRDH